MNKAFGKLIASWVVLVSALAGPDCFAAFRKGDIVYIREGMCAMMIQPGIDREHLNITFGSWHTTRCEQDNSSTSVAGAVPEVVEI